MDYVGDILLIRYNERVIPVFCIEAFSNVQRYEALKIRPRREYDDAINDFVVCLGSDCLKTESIALPNRCIMFKESDVIRVITHVGKLIADEAKNKRARVYAKVEKERKLADTKGLPPTKLQKLERKKVLSKGAHTVAMQATFSSRKMNISKPSNLKPYSGGSFSSK